MRFAGNKSNKRRIVTLALNPRPLSNAFWHAAKTFPWPRRVDRVKPCQRLLRNVEGYGDVGSLQRTSIEISKYIIYGYVGTGQDHGTGLLYCLG